jgi:hypothetical protein
MTAGGPRPGAGRKIGTFKDGEKKLPVQIKLEPSLKAMAFSIGDGNISLGIRRALLAWKETEQ